MTPKQIAMFDLMEEMDRAELKHGDWSSYSPFDIQIAVTSEFHEYGLAVLGDDLHGRHGQRAELLQLACVAIKGYIRLGNPTEGLCSR